MSENFSFVRDCLNLFEIAYLTPNDVKKFRSDFRYVADYFVQMRMTGDYHPATEDIEHFYAVAQMLSVMTSDRRFEEAAIASQRGELKNMSEFLDRLEAKKEQEVRESVAADMLSDGEPIKKIEKYSKLSEGEIREIAHKLGVTVNEG